MTALWSNVVDKMSNDAIKRTDRCYKNKTTNMTWALHDNDKVQNAKTDLATDT